MKTHRVIFKSLVIFGFLVNAVTASDLDNEITALTRKAHSHYSAIVSLSGGTSGEESLKTALNNLNLSPTDYAWNDFLFEVVKEGSPRSLSQMSPRCKQGYRQFLDTINQGLAAIANEGVKMYPPKARHKLLRMGLTTRAT